jgi:CheY-like chemotaxis protein
MTGTQAASILRNELNYKGLIIGVTGNALQEDVDDFLANGADIVIIKPLTSKKFTEAVEQCDHKIVKHAPFLGYLGSRSSPVQQNGLNFDV